MQIYFPNFKSKQGAIGIFDYLMASRDANDANVIFNSDLNLEELSHLKGGTGPIENYASENNDLMHSFLGYVIQNLNKNNAQLFQDLYVLWKLKNKTKGTFVEVGTAYPTGANNTWVLESQFNWQGVLIEPNPFFHEKIRQIRKMPLEISAIHYESKSDLVLSIPDNFHPGAGIEENKEEKVGSVANQIKQISVDTISLNDCLNKYKITKEFDYLSYDTTGNFADIQNIKDIFANGYVPKIITIGHNYKSHRPDLCNMLQSQGYKREFDYLSRWDDWYYHTSLEENK